MQEGQLPPCWTLSLICSSPLAVDRSQLSCFIYLNIRSTNEASTGLRHWSSNVDLSSYSLQILLVCVGTLLMWFLFILYTTGKGRLRFKEGHWWDGSPRDQVRRLGLFCHACGNRAVAFLPGAWCQIISPRSPEKKGTYGFNLSVIFKESCSSVQQGSWISTNIQTRPDLSI